MTARTAPRTDSIEFQWDHFVIEHGDHPAHRPYEALVGLAPVHALGPVERRNLFRKDFRQNLARASPFFRYSRGQILALWGRSLFELRNINTRFFRERMRCRSWLTIFVCDTDR